MNISVIGGGRNALEGRGVDYSYATFEKSMSPYSWELELLFLTCIVDFVTTILATFYVLPHQQYIPLYFGKYIDTLLPKPC